MNAVLFVAVGGAMGSVARFLLSTWITRLAGHGFPLGTLTVNLLGSFAISLFHQAGAAGLLTAEHRLFLTTGLLGGFTTYSTFNYETLTALETGAYGIAALNVAGTLLGCLVGGYLGLVAGRGWRG